MTVTLPEWIAAFFGSGQPEQTDGVGPDGGVSTTLYWCPDCEITFLSEEMNSCPACNGVVDRTPSEHELGFASADD